MFVHNSSRVIVTLLALVAGSACAQASRRENALVVSPVSPLELANIVRNTNYQNVNDLWRKLSIDATPLDGLLNNCPCDAQARSFPDSEKQPVTVVRVGQTLVGTTFLVFGQGVVTDTRQTWVLLGHIDFPHDRDIPEYSLIDTASDRFLVIHPERDRGSGIGAESVEWYMLQDRGVGHVLSYPGKAYMSGAWLGPFGPSAFISSNVVSLSTTGNEQLLKVHFSLSLRDDEHNSTLCTVDKTATFVRSDSMIFALDPNRSEIAADELSSFFDITSASFRRSC